MDSLSLFLIYFLYGSAMMYLGRRYERKKFEGSPSLLESITELIHKSTEEILMTLDDLKLKVDAESTVEASAITLLQELSAKLTAAASDPVKVQAIADELSQNSAALAAAITANTPA